MLFFHLRNLSRHFNSFRLGRDDFLKLVHAYPDLLKKVKARSSNRIDRVLNEEEEEEQDDDDDDLYQGYRSSLKKTLST